MPTFTNGNETYLVHTAGTFDLDMLDGDDTLTVQGGTSTTAHMGLGNDLVQLKSGLATVFGDGGADRFDIWAANATVDGGDDGDLINLRAGTGVTAHGGLGDDRFNFYADLSSLSLYGDDGNDDFYGYLHTINANLYGGAGDDYFVEFMTGALLLGGLGDDIYRATADAPATFIEFANEGVDSVQVARGASFTLADNIENISVQGFHGSTTGESTLIGNALANHITGHNNVETLYGLDGNDDLSAKGGNDTLYGGAGNDYLDGGSGNDTLHGDAGDDTLQGRAGDDSMTGGAGSDLYYVDSSNDAIVENAGEGTDTVRASHTYTLPANVENGIVSAGFGVVALAGNDLANSLTGSTGDDILYGAGGNDSLKAGDGNDRLIGGDGIDTLSGANGDDDLEGDGQDTLLGGGGDDTYTIPINSLGAGDTIIELAGAGIDSIILHNTTDAAPYWLPDNIENATSTAFGAEVHGNALDNILAADTYFAFLYGGAGNDTLIAGTFSGNLDGQSGDDTMIGSVNGDVFHVDSVNDVIVEQADGGYDYVYSRSLLYTLPGNVERGIIDLDTGATLHGNDLDNELIGGGGNDTLDGLDGNDTLKGGSGADAMAGGLGDDIYYVDNAGDSVGEGVDEGNDTVLVTTNYVLTANVEAGTVTTEAGVTLTGNASNNILTGNAGDDVISGQDGDDTITGGGGHNILLGGAGNDVMTASNGDTLQGGAGNDVLTATNGGNSLAGGAGDDTYYVTGGMVDITELGNEGYDIVHLTPVFLGGSMTMPDNVEDVILENASVFAVVHGNALDNHISYVGGGGDFYGGGGNDTILADGFGAYLAGEAGNDRLTSGGGDDTLLGGFGNDVLSAGAGDDWLSGSAGADTMTGGAGNDVFAFQDWTDSTAAARDSVQDFRGSIGRTAENDMLDFSAIDANINLVFVGGILQNPNEEFSYIGTNAFNGVAGQLRVTVTVGSRSTDYLFQGDVNGDANADFTVLVHLVSGTLTVDNLVL